MAILDILESLRLVIVLFTNNMPVFNREQLNGYLDIRHWTVEYSD